METQVMGTLVDGIVRLDECVDIPNNTRVKVVLQTLDLDDSQSRYVQGLQAWIQSCQDHPISSGGLKYTRDELHERR
ncbi:MAG: hypothetical protein IT422_21725 [Pirellulaceae bacterium]|nr:hypothetical protein [Pirellulaceae bacterium]